MKAARYFDPAPQYFYNGLPASGYKIHFFTVGTTSYKNIYTDSTKVTTITNPIVLDSQGMAPTDVYLDGAYDVQFATSTDTSPPTSPLWTRSNVTTLTQLIFSVANKSSNYTVLNTDCHTIIRVDASSGNKTITLPSAAATNIGAGFGVWITKIDATANTVTIAAAGGETINGSTSQVISVQFSTAFIASNGTNWDNLYTISSVAGTVTSVGITAPAAGITVSGSPVTAAGSMTLALADDLAAVEGLASNGLAARTGTSTWSARTLTAPAAGITVTNGDGVSGNPTLVLANDLAALEGLSSNGIVTRTATDTMTVRTVTGTANKVTVTNGDGVSGNPTLTLPTTVDLSGNTSLLIPTSTSTVASTSGAIAIDTNTDNSVITQGSLEYYDGTRLMYVAGYDTLPTTDGHALQYDLTNKKLKFGAIAGSGTPGGADTQVQFNDGGAFGGDAGFTYNKTTDVATLLGGLVIGGNSTAAGYVDFKEDTDNGTNKITFTAPSSIASDKTHTLRDATGTVALTSGSTGIVCESSNAFTARTLTAHSDASTIITNGDGSAGNPTVQARLVQKVSTATGAVATGTTTIPADDTIPQKTEGDEYMTLAITPKNTNNKLVITATIAMDSSTINAFFCMALFQDTTSNALCCNGASTTSGWSVPIVLRHVMTAGTTSSTTFKIRLGAHAAGTTTFNGTGGARYFGGVLNSGITIEEYVP